MYFKIALNFILIAILVIFQFSFISALPAVYCSVNILLVAIIFVLALFGSQISWWWAFSIGCFYDTISFTPFGVFLISYTLVFLVINFLQKNFFTNRSLYSFFALIIFASLTFKFAIYGAVSILSMWSDVGTLNFFYQELWHSEFFSLLINILLVLIVYVIVNFASKRLKPTFLIRR